MFYTHAGPAALPGRGKEQQENTLPSSEMINLNRAGHLTKTISPTLAGFQHVILSHIPGQPIEGGIKYINSGNPFLSSHCNCTL